LIWPAGKAIPLAAATHPGNAGIGVAQLHDDGQPNKCAPLVVIRVMEGPPAAKAGIERFLWNVTSAARSAHLQTT
jgi:hypothetical protein